MLVRIQKDVVGLAHHAAHQHRKFLQPVDARDAGHLLRLFFRQLVPLPRRDVLVGLAHEQHLAVLFLVSLRTNHKNRLLLAHARQVKQIGVRHRHHRAVRVRRHNVVRIHDDHRLLRKQRPQTLAVRLEKFGIDRRMSHARAHAASRLLRQVSCRSTLPVARPVPVTKLEP
jgi:hypothetical protein